MDYLLSDIARIVGGKLRGTDLVGKEVAPENYIIVK